MSEKKLSATLLISCPDKRGLVARIAHFIFERGGNILDLDEHVDSQQGLFFLRVTWDMSDFSIAPDDVSDAFTPLAREFQGQWMVKINHASNRRRLALFV